MMVTASESRAALEVVSLSAVATVTNLFGAVSGSPVARRAALLDGVPEVVSYFSEGSAALAVDFYEEERDRAGAPGLFAADFVVNDRTVKLRRAVAWASDPLFTGDEAASLGRLAEVVQLESARPYRDTILGNQKRDSAAVGWRRVPNPGACPFCLMLAGRGSVYKRDTAQFASHPNCHCSAQPVFGVNDFGPEATDFQYIASKRSRSPAQKAALREYLSGYTAD